MQKLLHIFILSCLILLSFNKKATGQPQAYIDSLENTLDTIQSVVDKAELLNKLAMIYSRLDLPKAITYAKSSLDLVSADNIKIQGFINNTLGILYGKLNKLDSCTFFFKQTLNLYFETIQK